MRRMLRWLACLAGLALVGAGPPAPPLAHPSEDELDVGYVPTPSEAVTAMLALAGVTKDDVVYDLGCGDGRIVVAAARSFGARGVGVDLDPRRVAESRENARRAGVAGRVTFVQQDLFQTDLRPATVVALYLLGSLNERLRPKLLAETRPGTRVVSHAFRMGEWEPDDETATAGGAQLFLWVVPADASGTWTVTPEAGGSTRGGLVIDQRFQRLGGTAEIGDAGYVVREGRVRGDRVTLALEPSAGGGSPLRLSGRVVGERIAGTTEGSAERWIATRSGASDATPSR